jgi:hypothetical protein
MNKTIPSTDDDAVLDLFARDAVLREAAAAAVDVLHRGGSKCIRVPGTFPQQFICAGTADQIERLLDEPEL